jgi:hypothetical protein
MHRRSKEEMSDPRLQKEIADLYRNGAPIWRLRRKYRCGDSCVRAALAAHGVPVRPRVVEPSQEELQLATSELRSRLSREVLARRECRANPEEWALSFLQAEEC